jgi:hypothetical protein
MINKILLFLFFSIYLLGLDYYFSIENNSINIQRNKNIDIVFNAQALKEEDGDFLDDDWIQGAVSIKENNNNGKKILFTTDITYGLYTTFSLFLKNMKSNFKYLIIIDGDKFKNKVGELAIDKNISFTTADFLDILYPKEINITLNSSKKIPIYLSESPSQDIEVKILSNDKNITISPSSVILSSINYADGIETTITTSSDVIQDGNYTLFIKNDSLDIMKETKLKIIDNKVFLMVTKAKQILDKKWSFDVKINKPTLDPYNVLITKKSALTLSKSKLTFTRFNFDKYQTIEINTKGITKDTNDTLSLTSRDMNLSFDMKIIIPKIEEEVKESNESKKITISIVKTTSLFSKISWSAKKDYNGLFSIYKRMSKTENKIHIADTNVTNYMLSLKPNTEYFISINYKNDTEDEGSINIKSLKADLKDSNKNGLSDDLEELLNINVKKEDINQDGISDVVQKYLLKLENNIEKTLNDYTLSSDIDGDKLADFLELNMARNPIKDDFNGNTKLEITIVSDGVSIYVSSFDELETASKVKANNNALINGYVGDGCLSNGILVANFLHKDDCRDIKKEIFSIGNKNILWVAIDDFGNIAYKKQTLSIFQKSDSNNSDSNTIIFTVDGIDYTIKSTVESTLSFGKLAKSKSYTNPIIYEKDILASKFKFTNNIFDIIIQSAKGVGSVVIKQPITIQNKSHFRIFKDGKYHIFNTSLGDKIYSTRGYNNNCNFDDTYTEFLTEKDYCIKLDIKDGGLNDSDGLVNGSVSLIGGVSTTPGVVSINDKGSIGCSSLHASGFNKEQIKFDYLMVFSFLISFAYVIRMFTKKRV